jgi:hypothetical protein
VKRVRKKKRHLAAWGLALLLIPFSGLVMGLYAAYRFSFDFWRDVTGRRWPY